jgi:hypothetical protein
MFRNFSTLQPLEISYIIEVNGNPGTKIIDITGYNYFNDLVEYIETKVEKTIEPDEAKATAQAASAPAESWSNAP